MRCVYFDCFSGASGDMIVGALLDAGLAIETLRTELDKLGLSGYHIEASRVKRGGIAATGFKVVIDRPEQKRRHLRQIVEAIDGSGLSERIKRDSRRIFRRLAEAEAGIHDTDVEKVHFHEVGAVDAIVDIVGACVALEKLGIEQVTVSALPTGTGFVDCEHGKLPVPAPATAALLVGFPVAPSDVEAELTTPTGAAVLTTLGESFGSRPAMDVASVGYGAGAREMEHGPNLLRVIIGETETKARADRMWVLETNIDDMPAELFEVLFERLFAAGAMDVFTTAIQMKKGRPGVKLSVILADERRTVAEDIVFRETTTFGIRAYEVERHKLGRESVKVHTQWGEVSVKLGRLGRELVTVSPEYDDCRRIAARHGVALKDVYEKVRQAARDLT